MIKLQCYSSPRRLETPVIQSLTLSAGDKMPYKKNALQNTLSRQEVKRVWKVDDERHNKQTDSMVSRKTEK